ncbi:sugar phosphate nucleotidyltransferase [Rubrobacter aplysinae]|uniref:sugar phosphate nucleotidyltransferase n=1 Tax=Rubrobacter aplysinae TaxID=909625 RepID=UPI00069EC6ED|nr:sugar phosphate nucleotidyltransferase [Rubrobacter aplysinae]
MKAVIMAGGQGTRLRPLTSNQPKPMIPIVGVPCMEHIVNLLKRHGFEDIVVTLQFMPDEIRDYFGDGSEWGVNMRYSVEDVPAGTAGSVKMAEEEIKSLGDEDERFLVISGDALTDSDLTELLRFHDERGSEATMVLKSVENPLDFGIVITEEDGRISRFLEKPAWGQVFSDTVNTGIYLLESSVLAEIPDRGEYDFSADLFPRLLEDGRPMYGYITGDYWEDIGTLEQYSAAQRDVLDGKVGGVRPPGTRLKESIYVGQRVQVDEEALSGPVVIGDNSRIEEGAYLGPYSVIEANTVVSAGASVERSVIADGSYIGDGAELIDTLVGRSSYIQPRARLLERSALGDDVIVGEGATVSPEVKVYPHKTVESGANVTQSLIYESMGLRTLFKGGVVSGKFNVDVTPEFVIRLASSLGTTLDPGAIVTVGRDDSLQAQVSKRALVSAINGTGISVRDLRAAHAGVVRHDVLAGKASAGVHVRSGYDRDDVEILFFSSDATPMTEADQRSVEKVYVREEYRRAYADDIGEVIYPGRAVEQYVERLERALDRSGTSGITIVVDFSEGVANLVASRVFSRLGVNAVVLSGFSNANVARVPGPGAGGITGASGHAGQGVYGTQHTQDTKDTCLAPEARERLDRVGRIVPSVGAAFGCVVGPTGEDLQFVDDRGELVPPGVMLACVMHTLAPPRAVLPLNLTSRYADLLGGGELLESRTGLGNVSLKASEEGATLAGTGDGRYIFPDFLPAPDCFMTIGKALELFGQGGLSHLRTEISEPFGGVVYRELECPWTEKGRVMRGLAERFGGDPDVILTDGIKLNLDDGWVLMLPDPDNPLFYVYAEHTGNSGNPESVADKMADEHADLVGSLIQDTPPDTGS